MLDNNSEVTGEDEKLLHDKPNTSTAIAPSNDTSNLEDEFFGTRNSLGKTNDNELDDSVRKTVSKPFTINFDPETLILCIESNSTI